MRRLVALLFMPLAIAAQTATVSLTSSTTPGALPFSSPVTNNPVSLVEVRTRTQTLADGTHIVRKTREMFYRDAQGRTRSETELPAPAVAHTQIHTVTVYDPIAGKTLTWTENPSATRKEYFARTVTKPALMADAPPPVQMEPVRNPPLLPDTAAASNRPQVQREDLGMHDVQGFPCKADRSTTTYPVDFLGNDRPIVVTEERCVSRELGRTLQQTRSDPRSGVTTLAVESLTRGEPSPTLFQPPAGYTERAINTTLPAQ